MNNLNYQPLNLKTTGSGDKPFASFTNSILTNTSAVVGNSLGRDFNPSSSMFTLPYKGNMQGGQFVIPNTNFLQPVNHNPLFYSPSPQQFPTQHLQPNLLPNVQTHYGGDVVTNPGSFSNILEHPFQHSGTNIYVNSIGQEKGQEVSAKKKPRLQNLLVNSTVSPISSLVNTSGDQTMTVTPQFDLVPSSNIILTPGSVKTTSSTFSSGDDSIGIDRDRSWRTIYETPQSKELIRNVSFKMKTRTDAVMSEIPPVLYSSLKYQFNVAAFVSIEHASKLLQIHKESPLHIKHVPSASLGGFLIATIETALYHKTVNTTADQTDDILEGIVKGETQIALQPIEAIEATEAKAFKPFLSELRQEIYEHNSEDSQMSQKEWACLHNKTKVQFTDMSVHSKKNHFVLRVRFFLSHEFKEQKPILVMESAPFRIYARRSKRLQSLITTSSVKPTKGSVKKEPPMDEQVSKKRQPSGVSIQKRKKRKHNILESNSPIVQYTEELSSLVQLIRDLVDKDERKRAIESVARELLDPIEARQFFTIESNKLIDTQQPSVRSLDLSLVKSQNLPAARLVSPLPNVKESVPSYNELGKRMSNLSFPNPYSAEMFHSIGQQNVLDAEMSSPIIANNQTASGFGPSILDIEAPSTPTSFRFLSNPPTRGFLSTSQQELENKEAIQAPQQPLPTGFLTSSYMQQRNLTTPPQGQKPTLSQLLRPQNKIDFSKVKSQKQVETETAETSGDILGDYLALLNESGNSNHIPTNGNLGFIAQSSALADNGANNDWMLLGDHSLSFGQNTNSQTHDSFSPSFANIYKFPGSTDVQPTTKGEAPTKEVNTNSQDLPTPTGSFDWDFQ